MFHGEHFSILSAGYFPEITRRFSQVYFGLEGTGRSATQAAPFLQGGRLMEWLRDLTPGVASMLVPIVAIICGIGYAITKAIIHHRERMAMIERGMNPDTIRQQK
jgi:hypothetical protein